MKKWLVLASAASWIGVNAQIPPDFSRPAPAPRAALGDATTSVPRAAPASRNEDLAELIRAQTSAIRALSAKVDALEKRIADVESREKK